MIAIFTDGACSGNPGPGGWACVIATPGGRAFELAGRADATTNNRMEMSGVIAGLREARSLSGRVVVHTDSTYVLGGITRWIAGWKRRGWTTAGGEPVKNADLWRELDMLTAARGEGGVEWRWVRGHAGHEANERCDELAVALARRKRVRLYDGPITSYPHGSLLATERYRQGSVTEPYGEEMPLPNPLKSGPPPHAVRKRPSEPKAQPLGPASYLSLLEGRLERHATWKECEARVKGRSGAKFKKVRSQDESRATKKSWGL